MANRTNSIGQTIKTLAGQATTAANSFAKEASAVINSANIDINGLSSAVEGVEAELQGAISSLSNSVPTVASSLMSTLGLSLNGSRGRFPHLDMVGPPWANPLEPYATVNYIWTLSCLTVDELNRPDATYRLRGPTHVVCKSGGSGSSKVKTSFETFAGAVEFYIDDVSMQTVITHNKGTKQADAIGGSFKIFEPYSMGMFYETLEIAAKKCGYKNYIDAPFMLSLQFKGWDDLGNVSFAPGSTRHFPVHIINSTFNVTEQGSTYDVAFVKHNDQPFGDQTQATKTDLNLAGNTVQELLQTGAKSLAGVINGRLLKDKEAKQTNKVDQYVIMFPTERSSAKESILGKPSESETGATVQTPPEGEIKELSQERKQEIFESIAGLGTAEMPEAFESTISKLLGITIQRSEVGEAIRSYAENPEHINIIGQSKIVKSKNDSGTKPSVEPNTCDAGKGVVCRAQVQEPTTSRSFQFSAGTKIQDIIEEIIISSDWGRGINERLKSPDNLNMVDWFKIESQVFESADSKTVDATGANPKTYVYRIVKYKVNASRFASPTKITPNIEQLKRQAAKEYNYIYTGKNKDIIDFDIQFNTAFFVGIGAQKGQASKDSKTSSQGSQRSSESETTNKQNDGRTDAERNAGAGIDGPGSGSARTKELTKNTVPNKGGGGQEWSETQTARSFNDALLDSPADLMKVDLKIWGDPYWLSDSGVGNYIAEETEFINITKDGSMDYQSSEVDCVLNFRTPFDIGGNGWMQFNGISAPTKLFSGLYQCIGIQSEFNGGKFEQTLTLIRRRNQVATVKKADSDNAVITDGAAENKIGLNVTAPGP